jgi:hypothetical protein
MSFPNDENGDVFRRMEASAFDFSIPHNVDFFAVFPTMQEADAVAKQFIADHHAGALLVSVETYPSEKGGTELMVVKEMLVTHENVTRFEKLLAQRAEKHDGYVDGWGVMQE